MLAGDLLLVGADERAAAYDFLAADEQPVDPMRAAEHEIRDEVVRPAELEPVGPPDRQVGAPAGCERANVLTAKHRGAAARAEAQRVARGHRLRAAATAGDEQRLLHLREEIASLVRRTSVDAEPRSEERRVGKEGRSRWAP